ncbi:MAG TPA: hypothetical protein PLO89_07150 [Spirochaetota bacterium]|nr:hypothetical protein [Spirochaetota bacterium]
MINKEDAKNEGINIIDNVTFDLLRLTLVSAYFDFAQYKTLRERNRTVR